jgi:hypothetical protein
MAYKYVPEFLVGATKLPAAIEAKLPAGAPKLSQFLTDTANRLPTGPALPVDIPELPEPMLPELPELPGGGAALGLAPRPTAARGRITEREATTTMNVGARGKL